MLKDSRNVRRKRGQEPSWMNHTWILLCISTSWENSGRAFFYKTVLNSPSQTCCKNVGSQKCLLLSIMEIQGGQFEHILQSSAINRKPSFKCLMNIHFFFSFWNTVGLDGSVGVATRYGLEGPGMESQLGRDFQHLESTQPPIKWVPGPFPGVRRPERSANHPHPPSVGVKKRVELCLYSLLGRRLVLGWTLPSLFPLVQSSIIF